MSRMSSGDCKSDLHLVRAAGAAAVDVAVERGGAVVDRVPVVVAAFAVFLTPEKKQKACFQNMFDLCSTDNRHCYIPNYL